MKFWEKESEIIARARRINAMLENPPPFGMRVSEAHDQILEEILRRLIRLEGVGTNAEDAG